MGEDRCFDNVDVSEASWCTPKLFDRLKYEYEVKIVEELGHTLWFVALWG
jgi:hypothetical protein